jgi:predicted esterase
LERGDRAEIYVRVPAGEWKLHSIQVPSEGDRIEVSAPVETEAADPQTSTFRAASDVVASARRQIPATAISYRLQDDVADVPAQDLRAGGDAHKRYFLIGEADQEQTPAEGYKLLFVLPGGDGSAGFHPFVKRIYKYALGPEWLVAQPVAPEWDAQQFDKIVWPTIKDRYPQAEFATEALIAGILKDVQAKVKIDPRYVFMLGWSSGGPPVYATTLLKHSPIRGAFVAMSIFIPSSLPPLAGGKGKAFYLLQSPDDRATKFFFAERAEKALARAGANVKLERYAGGHGWRGNVYGMLRGGIEWLEQNAPAGD